MARGVTLLEVVIAASVLSIALILAFSATDTVNRATTAGVQYSGASTKALKVLDRFAEDVGDASLGTVVIDAPDGDRQVSFQRVLGYDLDADTVRFGTPITYRWEVDRGEIENDADDNGNGVVDEGRVVREQDGISMILARDISKDGFVVLVSGKGLEATVRPFYWEVREAGARVPVTVSFSTSVPMDN